MEVKGLVTYLDGRKVGPSSSGVIVERGKKKKGRKVFMSSLRRRGGKNEVQHHGLPTCPPHSVRKQLGVVIKERKNRGRPRVPFLLRKKIR